MNIHTTHHIYKIALKKNGFEHIFILEFSPTSKNVPNKFFLLMGAKCMGYNFFFKGALDDYYSASSYL